MDTANEIIKKYYADNLTAHKESFKEIKEALNNIFGKENNQVEEIDVTMGRTFSTPYQLIGHLNDCSEKDHYKITIRFPKITISNSFKHTHEIQDLFVRFSLLKNLTLPGDADLKGMRTTFTAAEYNGGYTHSHLCGLCTSFSDFCLGTGQPIKMQMLQLRHAYDKVKFAMFLHGIRLYVQHESLEGVPYSYIDRIGKSEMPSADLPYQKVDFDRIYRAFTGFIKVNKNMLNYSVQRDKISITITDDFSKKMAETIVVIFNNSTSATTLFGTVLLNVLTPYKQGDGTYIVKTNITQNLPGVNTTRSLITFKKEPITLKIINEQHDDNTSTERYAHPQLTREICKRLENKVTRLALSSQRA